LSTISERNESAENVDSMISIQSASISSTTEDLSSMIERNETTERVDINIFSTEHALAFGVEENTNQSNHLDLYSLIKWLSIITI